MHLRLPDDEAGWPLGRAQRRIDQVRRDMAEDDQYALQEELDSFRRENDLTWE